MKYIAQDFLEHCTAGLSLVGQDEHGSPEWLGSEKNWRCYQWISDGAYTDLPDNGASLIADYLHGEVSGEYLASLRN